MNLPKRLCQKIPNGYIRFKNCLIACSLSNECLDNSLNRWDDTDVVWIWPLRVSWGAFLFSLYQGILQIKETEMIGDIFMNMMIIIITPIVLVIAAAYFIFRVYSCVFTISVAFAQLCALQFCAFTSVCIWIAS